MIGFKWVQIHSTISQKYGPGRMGLIPGNSYYDVWDVIPSLNGLCPRKACGAIDSPLVLGSTGYLVKHRNATGRRHATCPQHRLLFQLTIALSLAERNRLHEASLDSHGIDAAGRCSLRFACSESSYSCSIDPGTAGIIAWAAHSPVAPMQPQLREFTLTASQIDWELQPGTRGQSLGLQRPDARSRDPGARGRPCADHPRQPSSGGHHHPLARGQRTADMDGPAGLNQAPVEPGQSFVYDFIATPAGTRWYHSHTDVATQVMLGLYGAFIVEPKAGAVHYDRDYTYILSEWDNELTPDVATGAAPRGPRDSTLRGGEFGTDEFLMDGKMDEAIPPIVVKEGDKVLIRLINAGNLAHPFHTARALVQDRRHRWESSAGSGPTDQGHGADRRRASATTLCSKRTTRVSGWCIATSKTMRPTA